MKAQLKGSTSQRSIEISTRTCWSPSCLSKRSKRLLLNALRAFHIRVHGREKIFRADSGSAPDPRGVGKTEERSAQRSTLDRLSPKMLVLSNMCWFCRIVVCDDESAQMRRWVGFRRPLSELM